MPIPLFKMGILFAVQQNNIAFRLNNIFNITTQLHPLPIIAIWTYIKYIHFMNSRIKHTQIPLSIGFFLALLSLPYGYYELLRTVATILFIAYGVNAYKKNEEPWMYFWFGSALLINPIFKIALGRDLWNVVDVCWGVILIYKNIKDRKR